MRKNKTNILLNNLDSISNFKVYSKINSEYTKILGNHALKSFIKSLNNPTKVERKTFLKQIAEKYPYKEEQSSINYEQSLLKEKIETKEFLNKLINDSSTQTENSAKKTQNFIISLFRKPPKKDLTPTPCSYNPKYDYIFRRVQVCKITPEKITHNNNSNSDSNSNFVIKRNKLKKIVRNKTNKYNNLLVNKHKQEKKKKDDKEEEDDDHNDDEKEDSSKTKGGNNFVVYLSVGLSLVIVIVIIVVIYFKCCRKNNNKVDPSNYLNIDGKGGKSIPFDDDADIGIN